MNGFCRNAAFSSGNPCSKTASSAFPDVKITFTSGRLKEDIAGNVLEATVIDFKTMEGGPDPEHNEGLEWTELVLQVRLYAKAANEVLGENARTGAVHLLRDDPRIEVPVDDDAVAAAVSNVEWAVNRIMNHDFPMRPHPDKCAECDFGALCPQISEDFEGGVPPPALGLFTSGETRMPRAFSEHQEAS